VNVAPRPTVLSIDSLPGDRSAMWFRADRGQKFGFALPPNRNSGKLRADRTGGKS
jgi:hypothetical protein